jgi:hypothetical protein
MHQVVYIFWQISPEISIEVILCWIIPEESYHPASEQHKIQKNYAKRCMPTYVQHATEEENMRKWWLKDLRDKK